MEGSGSSGFDMSKMSTAEKLLAGGSILLLIDSFFPWQTVRSGLRLEDLVGVGQLASSMWQGSGGIFGVLAGSVGDRADRRRRALDDGLDGEHEHGHDVRRQAHRVPRPRRRGLRALEVHLRAHGVPGWGGVRRPRAPRRDRLGGLAEGAVQRRLPDGRPGGTMGGGTMGGGAPPPSAPPPSAPPPSAPPTEPPPSGGMPPSGSSDM